MKKNCQKKPSKMVTFWKLLVKKFAFFRRAHPFKISVFWGRRRLLKKLRTVRPKMDVIKQFQKGDPLGGEGKNPNVGASVPHFPENPPLRITTKMCRKRNPDLVITSRTS